MWVELSVHVHDVLEFVAFLNVHYFVMVLNHKEQLWTFKNDWNLFDFWEFYISFLRVIFCLSFTSLIKEGPGLLDNC